MVWSITAATRQNARRSQEDRHVICAAAEGHSCVAVFDGHNGSACAEYVARRLPNLLSARGWSYPEAELSFIYRVLAEETRVYESGTTAAIALLSPSGRVATGVLGDSLVIAKLNDTQVFVSKEHNARTNLAERRAAEACGAFYTGGYIFASPKSAGLQLTRALGDCDLAGILSRNPTTDSFTLEPGRFCLLCSDGLLGHAHPKRPDEMLRCFKRIEAGDSVEKILAEAAAIDDSDNATVVLCIYE